MQNAAFPDGGRKMVHSVAAAVGKGQKISPAGRREIEKIVHQFAGVWEHSPLRIWYFVGL